MKILKLINIMISLLFVLITSFNSYAMVDPAVAKEYCNKAAVDDEITKDEKYEYIKYCIKNLSEEDIEHNASNNDSEPAQKK